MQAYDWMNDRPSGLTFEQVQQATALGGGWYDVPGNADRLTYFDLAKIVREHVEANGGTYVDGMAWSVVPHYDGPRYGYGEDHGDDVRGDAEQWLGLGLGL